MTHYLPCTCRHLVNIMKNANISFLLKILVSAEQTGQAWGDIMAWADTGPHLMEILSLNT